MRVGLVGCVKSKVNHAAPAKDLYTSTLFVGRRRYVEQTCDRWFVLSALHRLVDPEDMLEPYNVTLDDQDEATRAAWTAEVIRAIEDRLGDLRGVTFEVHAGASYRDHGLVDGLRAAGASVEVPAAGRNLGEQLAFYSGGSAGVSGRTGYSAIAELLGRHASPVTVSFGDLEAALGRPLPPSARRHRPWWGNTDRSPQGRAWLESGWRATRVDMEGGHVTFTAGGRRAAAPRQGETEQGEGEPTPTIRLGTAAKLEPFSYRWPDATETFGGGWQVEATVGGTLHTGRLGLGHRLVFGADRSHGVFFLDGSPVVEGAATDDYESARTLVSMVKVGRRDVVDESDLPAGYENLDIVRHRDVVHGRGARRGFAVRLREDDAEGWVRHALLRLRHKDEVAKAGTQSRATEAAGPGTTQDDEPVRRPHDPAAVVAALLDHGVRLATKDASAPPAFTGDPEADRFVAEDPFAFLVAVISDQGIKAERAWRLPFELKRRLGFFDPERIAAAGDELRRAFAARPALHRLVNTVPTWVQLAAKRVLDEYDGDAGAIWGDKPTAAELQRRLQGFVGISQKKAAMATEILERDLGVTVRDLSGSDVAYDVHLRRVFLRSGIAERDDLSHMVEAARKARAERPGSLDFPVWDIGRRWCRPTEPRCDACVIGHVCPRLVTAAHLVRGM